MLVSQEKGAQETVGIIIQNLTDEERALNPKPQTLKVFLSEACMQSFQTDTPGA